MSEETKIANPLEGHEGFDPGEVSAPRVGFFTGLIVLVLVVVFIGVTLFYDKVYSIYYRERVEEAPSAQLDKLHAREQSELTQPALLDKEKGVARLPITRAMELVVAEAEAGRPSYPQKDQPVAKADDLEYGQGTPGSATGPGAKPAAPAEAK
jgi:hypothetical protein